MSPFAQHLRGSRRALEHRADNLQRFHVAFLRMAQQTKQMQGVELLGLGGKDRVADRLGICQPALLIMREGLRDVRCNVA